VAARSATHLRAQSGMRRWASCPSVIRAAPSVVMTVRVSATTSLVRRTAPRGPAVLSWQMRGSDRRV
jgi:hypothetical protein